MSQVRADRFLVQQLMQRYQLGRNEVYRRMKGLNIQTHRIGPRSYITSCQLELLDELHQFIQSKGTLPEFLEQKQFRNGQVNSPKDASLASRISIPRTELSSIVHIVAIAPDPLEHFEQLERAAQKQWYLSTSEIADLLKIPVDVVHQVGDRFSEAGFLFTQIERSPSGETRWMISKLNGD